MTKEDAQEGVGMSDDQLTSLDEEATQFTCFAQEEDYTEFDGSGTHEAEDEKRIPLDVGTIFLGKYKILQVLGEGNFGIIYLLEANDASKKLLVAKEFFPKGYMRRGKDGRAIIKETLTDPELKNFDFMKEIFIGEAKNLVKVTDKSHSNIVTFFSLEENKNNTVYFIMNYEKGISLKEYLDKKGEDEKLSNKEIYRIAIPLLHGLAQIHKAGVYHQDIKLENILIREDGSPILLDFGASVILYDKENDKYFNAATPKYAAIEQINVDNPPKINQTTDIYAMGVLLYRLISGSFPPKSKERMDAIVKGNKDPYISLSKQKTDGYDSHLVKSVDKALQISQDDRFQSAAEFSSALGNKKKIVQYSIPALMLIALLVYFLSPQKTGRLKLDIPSSGYEVYIDGEKHLLERDKSTVLKIGKHKIAIIKDGYVPFERSIDVSHDDMVNISVDMVPVQQSAFVETNVDRVSVSVNGRKLKENHFKARYGEKYTIELIAKGYSPIKKEVSYEEIFKSKFKLYFTMSVDRVDVDIAVSVPQEMGVTRIKINNLPIRGHKFIARKGKQYKIEILNPYYEPFKISKSFEELYGDPLLDLTLVQGRGKILFDVKPNNAKIALFRVVDGQDVRINKKAIYATRNRAVDVATSDKIYIVAEKEGFDSMRTRLFSVKHGTVITKTLHLHKAEEKKTNTLAQASKVPLEGELIDIKNRGFKAAKYETTYKEFARFLNGSNEARANRDKDEHRLYGNKIFRYMVLDQDGYVPRRGYGEYPVGYVTWYGADAYVKWLSRKTGRRYTLPSSTQWTKMALQGWRKDMIDATSNYNTGILLKVGMKQSDKEGVYDVFGNVFEWTSTDAGSSKHIIKGGSYRSKKSFLQPKKSSYEYDQNGNRADLGFRVFLVE